MEEKAEIPPSYADSQQQQPFLPEQVQTQVGELNLFPLSKPFYMPFSYDFRTSYECHHYSFYINASMKSDVSKI